MRVPAAEPDPETVEAAPSTDEGEARWKRLHPSGGGVWWRSPQGGYVFIDDGVEAAIRAPLEEQRDAFREVSLALDREKKALHEKWIHEVELRADAEERIREMELRAYTNHELAKAVVAENTRLREALREAIAGITEDVWPVEGPLMEVDSFGVTLARWRALATPPSSTEGSQEVDG